MRKQIKKTLYVVLGIFSIYLVIRFSNIDKNENLLNYFAEQYFDKQYYIANNPDVLSMNIEPYEHYIKYGWKEGKNPNKEFNTRFYVNLYLLKNKHNLNPLADYARARILHFKRYINPSELSKVEKLNDPKYYIALVAIFQNEARFLKEWIEFYRLIGVEHFYLYDHLSSDNYLEVLKPYIETGIVSLEHVKTKAKNLSEWNKIQTATYSKTVKSVADSVEWLIIVDTDEFLFPVKDSNLKDSLKKYDEYPAVSVNWKMFGSNYIQKLDSNKLLIETMTGRNPAVDTHVKSIVKPRYVDYIDHPHFAQFKTGYAQVSENFEYFKGPFSPEESMNILRINHYWARDLDFFESTKVNRIHMQNKNASEEEKQAKINWLIDWNNQLSSKYDDSIFKYVNSLRQSMFGE